MSEMTQTVTGATQPQSDDASRITARDLRSVFWRSFTLQGSWNYERQQHMGYAFAMSPALKRIYQDPTELGRALQRHLVLLTPRPISRPLSSACRLPWKKRTSVTPNLMRSR